MTFKFEPYTDEMPSAHYTPLPDIGDWKFESNFDGTIFRYTNPAYAECISWIRRRYDYSGAMREYLATPPLEWRILLPSGAYDCGAGAKYRQFKTPERAIKALETTFDRKETT